MEKWAPPVASRGYDNFLVIFVMAVGLVRFRPLRIPVSANVARFLRLVNWPDSKNTPPPSFAATVSLERSRNDVFCLGFSELHSNFEKIKETSGNQCPKFYSQKALSIILKLFDY